MLHAEEQPSVESVAEARKLPADDKIIALQMIDRVGENNLANKDIAVSWAFGASMILGQHLLQMVRHLDRHKSQLFYYLKLQGKPVNTVDLWVEP